MDCTEYACSYIQRHWYHTNVCREAECLFCTETHQYALQCWMNDATKKNVLMAFHRKQCELMKSWFTNPTFPMELEKRLFRMLVFPSVYLVRMET
jgi:hypothetical protein